MELISSVQIGKKGISDNLVETIKSNFKNHHNIKLIFLKSSFRDRTKIKRETENILDKLGKNYTYKIIGFTVFIKKWRKPKR